MCTYWCLVTQVHRVLLVKNLKGNMPIAVQIKKEFGDIQINSSKLLLNINKLNHVTKQKKIMNIDYFYPLCEMVNSVILLIHDKKRY